MMSFGKKILFFLFIVLWIPVFTAGAQEAQTAAADAGEEDSDSIMTVEEAYLSSAEGVIIKELAQSGGRDGKQVESAAVDAGRADDMVAAAGNIENSQQVCRLPR